MEIHLVRHNQTGLVGHAVTCPIRSDRWRIRFLQNHENEVLFWKEDDSYIQDLGVIGDTEENNFFS